MSSPSSRNPYYGDMYSDTSSNNSNLSQRPSSSSPATETTRLHDRYGHIPNQHLQFPHHLNQARGQEETRQSANSFTPTMFTYPGWPSMSTQHAPQHPASYYPGFSQYQAYGQEPSVPSTLQQPAGLHVSTFGAPQPQTVPQIYIAPPSPGQDRSAPNLYRMPTRPPMEAAASSAASAAPRSAASAAGSSAASSAESSAPRSAASAATGSPASAAASGTTLLSNSTPEPAQRCMSTLSVPSFQKGLSPGMLSPSSSMPNLISWLTPQRGLEGMQQQQSAEHGFTQSPRPNWTPQPNKLPMASTGLVNSSEQLVTPTTGRQLYNLVDCTPSRSNSFNTSLNIQSLFLTNMFVYETNKKCIYQNALYYGADVHFTFPSLLQKANWGLLDWMVNRIDGFRSPNGDMPAEHIFLIQKVCDLVCAEIEQNPETVPVQVLGSLCYLVTKLGKEVSEQFATVAASMEKILKKITNHEFMSSPEIVDQALSIVRAIMSSNEMVEKFLSLESSMVTTCLMEALFWSASGKHHSSELSIETLNLLISRLKKREGLTEKFVKTHHLECFKQAVGMLSYSSVQASRSFPLLLVNLMNLAPHYSDVMQQCLEEQVIKLRPEFSKADAKSKVILLMEHSNGDTQNFRATLLEVCQKAGKPSGATSSRTSKFSSGAGSSKQKYTDEDTSDYSPESSEDESESELKTMNASELLEQAMEKLKKMKFPKERCPKEQLAYNSRTSNVREIVRSSGIFITETEYVNIMDTYKSTTQIARRLTKAVFTKEALLEARVVGNLHSKAVAAINVASRQIAAKMNERNKSRDEVVKESQISSAISSVIRDEKRKKK